MGPNIYTRIKPTWDKSGAVHMGPNRPLLRRLDRCDLVVQSEAKYPFSGNVYYVTMQITYFTRKFRNLQRNLHCDVVHIATKWVCRLTLDCNGVFAIYTRIKPTWDNYGAARVGPTYQKPTWD